MRAKNCIELLKQNKKSSGTYAFRMCKKKKCLPREWRREEDEGKHEKNKQITENANFSTDLLVNGERMEHGRLHMHCKYSQFKQQQQLIEHHHRHLIY